MQDTNKAVAVLTNASRSEMPVMVVKADLRRTGEAIPRHLFPEITGQRIWASRIELAR